MSANRPAAFWIVLLHVFLVAAFGNAYAKLAIPIGEVIVFPTELVVVSAAVLGFRAIVSVPRDTITMLVVAFVGVGVLWLGIGGMPAPSSAGAKAFSFFVYSIFYFVVRGCAVDDEARWQFLRAIGTASIVGACIGLVQMRTGATLFTAAEEFEITSTGSTRWLGGDFGLYGVFTTLVFGIKAIFERKLALHSTLLLAAAALEIILSQHRSAFVALAVGFGATTLLGGSTEALRGLTKLAVIAVVGIVVSAYLFGSSYVDDTVTRLAHTSDLNDENINWRLLSSYEVFYGVQEEPLGHGFTVWDFLFNLKDPLTGSHNSLLDLAYRIGIPGLGVFLAIPVALVRRTRRLVRATGGHANVMLVSTCTCVLAVLTFACFNVVLETPYMSIFFWIFLGIAAGVLHERSR